jgi:HlyD family secretion protein
MLPKWVVDYRKRAEVNPSLIQADDERPADAAAANGRFPRPRPRPRPAPPRPGSGRARRHITRPQQLGAALIAAACVFAAVWYVPRIAAANERSLVGTVTSSGVVYLNFSGSGPLATISARVGQRVRQGQLLATEAAPQAAAVLAAARAAIAADKAELAAEHAAGTTAGAASAQVQLARDHAQLALDRADAADTRLVAPADGIVIAVNGQPGETASAEGIRDYSGQGQGVPATQQPLFSLFPEGPQPGAGADGPTSDASLPVIALRTSSTWQVSVLVPQGSVAAVRPGQAVTIDVPAAGVKAISGRVDEVLSTPVATAQGLDYQAVVTAGDHRGYAPPSGMAANVQLGS